MYRLLLADDEKMVLVSVRHSVDWERFCFSDILETTNAQTAQSLLEGRRIDVAILDIRMPVYTAFDIIKACQAKNIRTTFLILTGYSDFQYTRQAICHGVFDYLLKPLQPESLSDLFPRLLHHLWQQRLLLDPPILERLYTERSPRQLLAWLGAPLASPWFCLLVIKCPGLDAARLFPLQSLEACILLASFDEAVLFLGSDRDPYAYLDEFIRTLPVPCCASFSLIGQDLSCLPALLARIRQENNRVFMENPGSCPPCLHNVGYHQIPDDDDTFLALLREIETNYTQELSLSLLAEKYNIGYAHLSNLFSRRTGLTFSQYLRNLRMQKAKELLKDTLLPVNLIGEQTGYPDYRHFAKTFRKEFGMTPSEFRTSSQPTREELP